MSGKGGRAVRWKGGKRGRMGRGEGVVSWEGGNGGNIEVVEAGWLLCLPLHSHLVFV